MTFVLAQAAAAGAADPAANDTYLWGGFILMVVAAVLFLIEFVVPSGGLLALLCGAAAIASIVSFFRYDTTWGTVALISYLVATPFILIGAFKLWLNSPLANKMILGGEQEGVLVPQDEAAEDSERARRERLAALRDLVGVEGVTTTALRPVGTISIDGRRLDAMAETGVIEAGTPIIISDVYDNQVKVRPR